MNCSEASENSQIKTINLGELGLKSWRRNEIENEEWERVAKELVQSFEEIGFAYISNHGIPQQLIEKSHRLGEAFFKLPQETKAKYSKDLATKQGYVESNRELLHDDGSLKELRESYDAFSPNGMFPSEIEDLQNTVKDLMEAGEDMSFKLLKCLEIGLNLERGTLINTHQSPFTQNNATLLRILHYPPVKDDIKEGAIRCGAHSDYGTFTLLFQDNMGGLEVKNRRGEWVKADPIPGTILVNVGDLLQMWTGDRLVATHHRVLIPKEEIQRRCSRRSIVLFFHPDDEITVKPLDGSSKYPPIKAGDHLRNRYKSTYKY